MTGRSTTAEWWICRFFAEPGPHTWVWAWSDEGWDTWATHVPGENFYRCHYCGEERSGSEIDKAGSA